MTAERFNDTYPVGTPVRYWPGAREGDGQEPRRRTPAWEISGHSVVSVEGYAAGIALTHVAVTQARDVRLRGLA